MSTAAPTAAPSRNIRGGFIRPRSRLREDPHLIPPPNFPRSSSKTRRPDMSVLGVGMLACVLLTLGGANGAPSGAPVRGRKSRWEGDRDTCPAPQRNTLTGEQGTSQETVAAAQDNGGLSTAAVVVPTADGPHRAGSHATSRGCRCWRCKPLRSSRSCVRRAGLCPSCRARSAVVNRCTLSLTL